MHPQLNKNGAVLSSLAIKLSSHSWKYTKGAVSKLKPNIVVCLPVLTPSLLSFVSSSSSISCLAHSVAPINITMIWNSESILYHIRVKGVRVKTNSAQQIKGTKVQLIGKSRCTAVRVNIVWVGLSDLARAKTCFGHLKHISFGRLIFNRLPHESGLAPVFERFL